MIRLACNRDIERIKMIMDESVEYIKSRSWGDVDYTVLKDDELSLAIKNKEGFVYVLEDEVVGFIWINSECSSEYDKIKWKVRESFFIIKKIVVSVDLLGCGVASWLLKFAEEFSKESLIHSIRVAIHYKNDLAKDMLIKNDYGYRGNCFLLGINKNNKFCCYEKII